MKISKANILVAVTKLIDGYNNNTLSHSTETCVLCHIYCPSSKCFKNCLNSVFAEEKNYSCVDRIREYSGLDWNDYTNKLDEYWTEILEMLILETETDIIELTKEIQGKILNIAEKYRK